MAEPDPLPASSLTAPIEALNVFVSVLSEIEAGEPTHEFYSRLCEATCRLTAMRRAVIFFYDDATRQARAAGSHGIDLALFAGVYVTAGTAEIARRSLAEDRVVEVSGSFERELPEKYLPLLGNGTLTCTPMSAGGRWYGVILADRAPEVGPLTGAQRHTLWTLGKMCALAASARIATRQHERARQLSERIDLARELHDRVVHRLFGVSLALSAEQALGPEERDRCRDELQAALGELRAALQRPLARVSRETGTTLHAELDRLDQEHPDLHIELIEGERVTVPRPLEPLAQSVLIEAVRNARKHARPRRVDVRLDDHDGVFVLEIVNDGVEAPRTGKAGVGLRLAAFEALEHGGLVEFGAHDPGGWRVRLAVPLEGP